MVDVGLCGPTDFNPNQHRLHEVGLSSIDRTVLHLKREMVRKVFRVAAPERNLRYKTLFLLQKVNMLLVHAFYREQRKHAVNVMTKSPC